MARIEAIRLGVLEGLPEAAARFGVGHCRSTIDLPIYSYLVQTRPAGLTLLFDLGCAPPQLAASRGHTTVGQPHLTAADALRALHVDPAAIHAVVVSHLHWDHSHGLGDFPNAEILIQRRELQYAFAPHPEQWAPYDSWELGLTPGWLEHLDRIRPLDGVVTLAEGVRVVPLPGHTPGSQGLVVDADGRTYCCCGDHLVTYENLEVSPRPGRSGGPVPPGVHTDLVAWRESLSRMINAGWIPLPAHEARVEAVLRGELEPPIRHALEEFSASTSGDGVLAT